MYTTYQTQTTHTGTKMKKTDLERKLNENDFSLIRHGSNHDVWAKGKIQVQVPRHREVDERTAKGILKKAGINI